jgi:hypothetical protein
MDIDKRTEETKVAGVKNRMCAVLAREVVEHAELAADVCDAEDTTVCRIELDHGRVYARAGGLGRSCSRSRGGRGRCTGGRGRTRRRRTRHDERLDVV